MDSESLLRFIPNYIAPGMGEPRLIDKIAPYIEAAEMWVNAFVADENLVSCDETLVCTRNNIIAARALYLAAPALDVTMHPNGLAVVNTDSIAPASAERAREFRKALEAQIISRIDFFLDCVVASELWSRFITTAPALSVWCSTIFYNCSDIVSYTGINNSLDEILNTVRKISAIENELGVKFVSPQLINKWRFDKGLQPTPPSAEEFAVLHSMKSLIAKSVEYSTLPDYMQMRSIVNAIRSNPDIFPEWHSSETAKLFSPPVFKNQKHSGGYFF